MRALIVVSILALSLAACGLEGPPGPAGSQGPAGPKGAPGAGGLASYTVCTGTSRAVGNAFIGFAHERYTFADGSVLATCEIHDQLNAYTDQAMYKAASRGAPIGACSLTYDVDNATGGFWTFEMRPEGTASTIAYTDTGASNGYSATLTTCQTY